MAHTLHVSIQLGGQLDQLAHWGPGEIVFVCLQLAAPRLIAAYLQNCARILMFSARLEAANGSWGREWSEAGGGRLVWPVLKVLSQNAPVLLVVAICVLFTLAAECLRRRGRMSDQIWRRRHAEGHPKWHSLQLAAGAASLILSVSAPINVHWLLSLVHV